jgi:hypothetical protein
MRGGGEILKNFSTTPLYQGSLYVQTIYGVLIERGGGEIFSHHHYDP